MTKALKVVMIVFGVVLILMGLINIILPEQWAGMHGMGGGPSYVKWMSTLSAVFVILVGFWVIVAGRDPLRHIDWVKFVIMFCILAVVADIYSIIRGYVDFSQIPGYVITDGVFAVVFLALYPWRAARSDE